MSDSVIQTTGAELLSSLHAGAARVLILCGGALSAVSAALVWSRADPSTIASGAPALFVGESALMRRAFDLRLGWINLGWALATCGIAAAALLLWSGPDSSLGWVPRVQMGLGFVVLALAFLHLAAYPGPLLSIFAGGSIVAGAYLAGRRGPRS